MTSRKRYHVHDRRGSNRPADGEAAACPECESGTLRFDEHYSVALATGNAATIPSWICDDCQYGRPVRVTDQRPPLRKSVTHVRAESHRQLMKARAVLQRAAKTLSKSLAHKKPR